MTRNTAVVNFSPKKLAGRSNSIAMGGPSPTHFSQHLSPAIGQQTLMMSSIDSSPGKAASFKLPIMPMGHTRMMNNLNSMQRTSSKAIGLSPQKSSTKDLRRRGQMAATVMNSPFVGTRQTHFQSQSDLGMLDTSPGVDYTRGKFQTAINTINRTKLNPKRVTPHIKLIDPASDDDEEGPELFIAQPTDDIPRNKLVDKLARGLQAYV